jgi:hypothetical protein
MFKPGQDLVCTVSKMPLSQDTTDTIARLMRLDPSNKKALRRAQRMRRQRMVVYNRGNRDWVSREKTARVVKVVPGATFTLPFSLDLAKDLELVKAYVAVKAK